MKKGKLNILNISNQKDSSFRISQSLTSSLEISNKKSRRQKQKQNKKLKNNQIIKILSDNLQKYNSTPEKKNLMIINDIMDTKSNHFLAIFKDHLISDYKEEFLKRYFDNSENQELIPKFYLYYKNYLTFFCKGMFVDLKLNKIIQEYGEQQAELYYNKNYGSKEEKKDEEDNDSNNTSINKIKLLFTDSVRNNINEYEANKMLENYITKYKTNEISNILYKSKNETITLNDATKIYNNDGILVTTENSLINIVNNMKKKKSAKINNKRDNYINLNNKNIVYLYKKLLEQSPAKTSKFQGFTNKNKNSKKISCIKIFHKGTSFVEKKKKKNLNISIENKDVLLRINSLFKKNNKTKNKVGNSNRSNIYIRNTSIFKTSRITTSRISSYSKLKNGNKKKNKNKFNVVSKIYKNKIKYNDLFQKYNTLNKNNIVLTPSSRTNNATKTNITKLIYKLHSITTNKTQNPKNLHQKKSNSVSNSNSIFNDFHININNNIMLLNSNNNINYNSQKNNVKKHSKSRNKHKGVDLKKYYSEKQSSKKSLKEKNICSNIRKYIYLVKCRSKEITHKSKEKLKKNKSNLYNSSCMKNKNKSKDVDIFYSFKINKKPDSANRVSHKNKPNAIFDYRKKNF